MHVELKSDTSGGRSGAAQPTYSSIADSELPNMISRPNSMYGVAGSDTFSDMDLIDLPHLMRNDDQQSISSGARNSFADLQRWKEESTAQALGEEHGGIEYEPEPRISDLLSPLHLEGVQHVEGDDSESDRSSNASSQIDWQSSLANKYPEAGEGGRRVPESESPFVRPFSISREKEVESYSELTKAIFANNGLSESMVTQNEQARGHYRKPSATLSELLSEYNDSERSSLPSYLEFGISIFRKSSLLIQRTFRGHFVRKNKIDIASYLAGLVSRPERLRGDREAYHLKCEQVQQELQQVRFDIETIRETLHQEEKAAALFKNKAVGNSATHAESVEYYKGEVAELEELAHLLEKELHEIRQQEPVVHRAATLIQALYRGVRCRMERIRERQRQRQEHRR
ncbi:hypothetical protein KRP22_011825 [Phytophthora ramorum]|nr:hypothetical protein KRP22_11663 [Phytophthora ramorum]